MYEVGDVLPFGIDITDADGNPADAGAVALTLIKPDKTTQALTTTHPSPGRYESDYVAAAPGPHIGMWVATGVNAGTEPQFFDVRPAGYEGIVSLADVKQTLRILSSSHDEHLKAYIAAATGIIERHTKEIVVRREFVEEYCSDGHGVMLARGPRPVVTGVTNASGAVGLGGLTTSGRWLRGLPYGYVTVTYQAGYDVVPANYLLAARMIVQRLWEQSQRAGTQANQMPDFGEDTPSDDSLLSRQVRQLLGPPGPLVA
ncbi:MAG TPA: head-tail connector protein [Streptosporangiaceae bacterium]